MKRIALVIFLCLMLAAFSGCAKSQRSASNNPMAAMSESMDRSRMIVWRAWLSLEVMNVKYAVDSAIDIAEGSGGYVESKSDSGEEQAQLTIRMPVDSMESTMASLESIGTVTSRRISSQDVTEQYIDIDARLKAKIALRDRLLTLINKATNVKELLAVEKELARVQADIDSMRARLKALKGKIDYASIDIAIKRKRILGPLGYVFKTVWWAIEKLIVIQE